MKQALMKRDSDDHQVFIVRNDGHRLCITDNQIIIDSLTGETIFRGTLDESIVYSAAELDAERMTTYHVLD